MEPEDIQVVGQSSGGAGSSPPSRRRWGAAVAVGALVVVGAVGLVTGSDAGRSVTVGPLPEPAPVTTTTLPSDSDPGLDWEETVGLEDPFSIGEVVESDGVIWAAGHDQAGIGLWQSGDGQEWGLVSHIDVTIDEPLRIDLAVVEGSLVVAAVEYGVARLPTSRMWTSADGVEWEEQTLPVSDPATTEAIAFDVVDTPDGVLVTGWSHTVTGTDGVMGMLPAPVRELVEEGQASMGFQNDSVDVWIDPFLSVWSGSLADLGHPRPSETFAPMTWSGPDLDDVVAQPSPALIAPPQTVEVTERGDLLGMGEGRFWVSGDGRGWEALEPATVNSFDFAVWNDGAITIGSTGGTLNFWDRSAGTLSPLSLLEFLDDGARLSQLSTSELGIVALSYHRNLIPREIVSIRTSDDTQIILSGSDNIEFVQPGGETYETALHSIPTQIDDAGRLVFLDEGRRIASLPVTDWLEAVRSSPIMSPRLSSVHILHSIGGDEWTSTPWSDFAGRVENVFPTLHLLDDFILAVDQGRAGNPITGAWIGRPQEGFIWSP